jgi:hypothetical protein
MDLATDANVPPLVADGSLRLLERKELNIEYVPIELGTDFKSIVDPHDLAMAETIIFLTVSHARKTEVFDSIAHTDRTPAEDDDDDDIRVDAPVRDTKTRYQVSRNDRTHRYRFVLQFPRGTRLDLTSQNLVFAQYPNRIIQRESSPIETGDDYLPGYCWSVAMHGYSIYSRSDIMLLHAEPVIEVTHVYPENLGRNNGEGKGVKRQREAEANERSVRFKKASDA